MILRLPLSIVSPSGRSGRLSILIFHRVLKKPDPLFPDLPDVADFESRMRWVRDWFNVLPLSEGIDRLFSGTIPPRALAISFDDGYADNEELAAPILKRLGLSATFFVATGFLGGGCMWNDRVIESIRTCEYDELDLSALGLARHSLTSAAARRGAIDAVLTGIKHFELERRQGLTDAIAGLTSAKQLPRLMMRPQQVRSLRELGMDVGAHTISHPILTRLSAADARREIAGSKEELEGVLGEPVRLFAYPNGVPGQDYAAEHAAIVRNCGFNAAVSTAWGAASALSDRFQLPRFTPWDRTRWRYGARLLTNFRRTEKVAS